jgi:group I intron endonuclease
LGGESPPLSHYRIAIAMRLSSLENSTAKDKLLVSGIYLIYNLKNGKFYVGSSVNIKRRWICHKRDLQNGSHCNSHLQRSWDKYGQNAFGWIVIEPVQDINLLIQREQFWIVTLEACKDGYNLNPTAGSCLGRKHSAEARAKMSKTHRGKKLSEDHKRKFLSARHAVPCSREIRAILSANLKARWASGEKFDRTNLIEASKLRQSKEWLCTSPDGEAFLVTNLNQFCKDKGLRFSSMWASARRSGGAITHKGWTCDYVEPPAGVQIPPRKGYLLTSPSGEVFSVTTLSCFCQEHQLSSAKMSCVASGKRRHHKGWKCQYADGYFGKTRATS